MTNMALNDSQTQVKLDDSDGFMGTILSCVYIHYRAILKKAGSSLTGVRFFSSH
jgi:hypothetical protein